MTQPLVQQSPVATGRPPLSAVPGPGQPADRKVEVARWAVTLGQPYITVEDRARAEAGMAGFITRNPDWSCVYFAGLLTDLSWSLPADDPWRHLSALIDLDQIGLGQSTDNPDKKQVRKGRCPVPSTTGAVIQYPNQPPKMFGFSANLMDLATLDVADPSGDIEFAPTATNLSPLAAALVAFAAEEPRTVQAVLSKTYHALFLANLGGHTEDLAGTSMLKIAGQAIQWLATRRRQYMGGDEDGYAYHVGYAWIGKSDRVITSRKPISTEPSERANSFIDDNAYRDLAGDEYVE